MFLYEHLNYGKTFVVLRLCHSYNVRAIEMVNWYINVSFLKYRTSVDLSFDVHKYN